jgi:hypothetical protein
MEQVLVLTIIGFILSVLIFIQSAIQLSYKEGYSWVVPLTISSILIITSFINLIIMADAVASPNTENVIAGDAVYQESYHIVKGDTIKTYKIVWDKKK